jgi:histone H3/H4
LASITEALLPLSDFSRLARRSTRSFRRLDQRLLRALASFSEALALHLLLAALRASSEARRRG